MFIFARARMGVEIDTSDHVPMVGDLIGLDLAVPRRGLPRSDVDAEQILGELEDAVADAAISEILPSLLPIVTVGLFLDELRDIAAIPGLQLGRARLKLLKHRQLLGIVTFTGGLRRSGLIVEQRLDLVRRV